MRTITEWMLLLCVLLVGAISGALIMDEWLAHKRRTDSLESRVDNLEAWRDEADKVLGIGG